MSPNRSESLLGDIRSRIAAVRRALLSTRDAIHTSRDSLDGEAQPDLRENKGPKADAIDRA
jgi:hypothetical protein